MPAELVFRFPFASSGRSSHGWSGSPSSVEALAAVHLQGSEVHPYESSPLRRAYLVRGPLPSDDAQGADGILVYAQSNVESDGLELRALGGQPLGVLRPVQTYVLASGIRRVEILGPLVYPQWLADDPWGYRVMRFDSDDPVAMTPPIVEELGDADVARPREREFILCDGTHRVVLHVWRSGGRVCLPVLLVDLPIGAPYYAFPQGEGSWEATSSRELTEPPATEEKYRPRMIDPIDPLSYRRLFRDLTSGFGPMGGQAGRPA